MGILHAAMENLPKFTYESWWFSMIFLYIRIRSN